MGPQSTSAANLHVALQAECVSGGRLTLMMPRESTRRALDHGAARREADEKRSIRIVRISGVAGGLYPAARGLAAKILELHRHTLEIANEIRHLLLAARVVDRAQDR